MYECSCGRKYRTEVDCLCGQKANVCKFRSGRVGDGSCGCGAFHFCDLLGLFCSRSKPSHELFTITLNLESGESVQLNEANFKSCSSCPDFVATTTETANVPKHR